MTLTPDLPVPSTVPSVVVRMAISGNIVERRGADEVVSIVDARLRSGVGAALAVGSVNLDHLHHFRRIDVAHSLGRLEWLMLADGMPIALRGRVLTATPWPRVTGADLLPRLLALAARRRYRVGFLGGSTATHGALADKLAGEYPGISIAGFWSPDRTELDRDSDLIAAEIASATPDILVVSLGKPLQERWVDRWGPATGAQVLLPFGAAADFMAGSARRAPQWMCRAGLEWLYRLACEPGRLARRYLVQGPVSLLRAGRAQLLCYPGTPYSGAAAQLPAERRSNSGDAVDAAPHEPGRTGR